ncbi:hypothetical protein [Nonomuraea sp. NPDC048916]|uniref:hypothetical protein n=1 Tax=Nonomuraea sp. NPDC048916 TaxID=3154232 RepID=UPI0033FD0C6C
MPDELPEAATDLSGPLEKAPVRPGESRPDGLVDPDVLLDVPMVQVERINLDVEDLRARVSLEADVLDLLRLHVGVDVTLGRVNLEISGVEAKALLKVRLDNVALIIRDVLKTIDNNPQLLNNLTMGVASAARDVGAGAGRAVGEVGASAGSALKGTVESVGDAARDVVGEVPKTARTVARTAGTAARDVSATVTGPPPSNAAPPTTPQPGMAPATAPADTAPPAPSAVPEEPRVDDTGRDLQTGVDDRGKPPAPEEDAGETPRTEEQDKGRTEERDEGRAEPRGEAEPREEGKPAEAGEGPREEERGEEPGEAGGHRKVERREEPALGAALKGLGKAARRAGARRLRDMANRHRSR